MHHLGTYYVVSDVDWQPKAQIVSLFCLPKEKLFRVVFEIGSAEYRFEQSASFVADINALEGRLPNLP